MSGSVMTTSPSSAVRESSSPEFVTDPACQSADVCDHIVVTNVDAKAHPDIRSTLGQHFRTVVGPPTGGTRTTNIGRSMNAQFPVSLTGATAPTLLWAQETSIEAAALGLGLTRVLSYQVATALQDGRLVRVLVGKESPAVPASLIYPGQGRLPMKTRAFIDFAVGRLRDRLSALDHAGAPGPSRPVTPVRGRRRILQR